MALIEMSVIFTAVVAASVGAAHDSCALFFGGITGIHYFLYALFNNSITSL